MFCPLIFYRNYENLTGITKNTAFDGKNKRQTHLYFNVKMKKEDIYDLLVFCLVS